MKVTHKPFIQTLLIMCSLCLIQLSSHAAKLVIPVGGFVDDATPIAVTPFEFQGEGTTPYDFAELISGDLASSGEFDPMSRSDMVVKADHGALFNYDDWRLLGADIVVSGQVFETGSGSYNLVVHLYDTIRSKQLLTYNLPVNSRNLRASGHHLSDVIYEKLTGVKGIFSTRVAYVNVVGDWANKTYELIVSDVDGENQAVVARSRAPLMSPTWSPKANKLAYVSFENGNSEVFIQDLATGSRTSVSSKPGVNSSPAFSPDGKKLSLTLTQGSGNLDVYVMDLGSGNIKRITDSSAIDTEANWSDDGETLYFTSDRAGQPQVYQVSKNGGEAQRISFIGKYNARPRVSADGKSLAVVHAVEGQYRIAMLNHSNGQVLTLTNGSLDEAPSVSPNGRVVIFATQRNGQGVLATVPTDGSSKPQFLPAVGDVREPAWSPFR